MGFGLGDLGDVVGDVADGILDAGKALVGGIGGVVGGVSNVLGGLGPLGTLGMMFAAPIAMPWLKAGIGMIAGPGGGPLIGGAMAEGMGAAFGANVGTTLQSIHAVGAASAPIGASISSSILGASEFMNPLATTVINSPGISTSKAVTGAMRTVGVPDLGLASPIAEGMGEGMAGAFGSGVGARTGGMVTPSPAITSAAADDTVAKKDSDKWLKRGIKLGSGLFGAGGIEGYGGITPDLEPPIDIHGTLDDAESLAGSGAGYWDVPGLDEGTANRLRQWALEKQELAERGWM